LASDFPTLAAQIEQGPAQEIHLLLRIAKLTRSRRACVSQPPALSIVADQPSERGSQRNRIVRSNRDAA
jgi:hypothetical protein